MGYRTTVSRIFSYLGLATEGLSTLTCLLVYDEDKEVALTLSKCLFELNLKHQSVIANRKKETDFDAASFTACGLTPVNCAAIVLKGESAVGRKQPWWLGCKEIQKWIV